MMQQCVRLDIFQVYLIMRFPLLYAGFLDVSDILDYKTPIYNNPRFTLIVFRIW